MSNAVATSKNTSIVYSRSTIITYFISMLFIYSIIDWYFFEKSISIFNGLVYCNLNNLTFIFFLFFLSFFILILTSFYPTNTSTGSVVKLDKSNEVITSNKFNFKEIMQTERDHYRIIEYPLITKFILIGGITLLSSNDLVTIFLCIELQSYGLYILSTLYKNSESSTSAGLTYFLLGGLSSCIILLGLSFIYINSGSTSLDGLYIIHNILTSDNNLLSSIATYINVESTIESMSIYTLNYYQYAIQFSLVVLAVGFLFKISAAPFHSWSPGVYDAIPTVTTTFVAIIPKISIFILFFDLAYSTWYTTFNYSWTNVLLFSSFLSLIIGSVLGLTQFKIKRLYAYSTISHVGFILLALCVHSVESIQAFFFYIIQYSLSNLNAFLILVLIGYTYSMYQKKTKVYEYTLHSTTTIYNDYNKKIKELSPIEYVDQLKGYFYLNPFLAISLSITLYSFIGVPPLVGFFAKQMVLSSALDNGDIFMCLVAILTSVISAVYYLYIIKHMFFEKSDYISNISLMKIFNMKSMQLEKNTLRGGNSMNFLPTKFITLSTWLTCTISILSLLMLLFIFLYYEIYMLVNIISVIIVY